MQNIRQLQQKMARQIQERKIKIEQERRVKMEQERRAQEEKRRQEENKRRSFSIPQPSPRPSTIPQPSPRPSPRPSTPPPSPKPLAPPAKQKIVSPPPKPMITNMRTKQIIMPISGSPVSSRNTSPTKTGLASKTNPNKPSIKSTFRDPLLKSSQLNDTQKILLQEIQKLQNVVNTNIKNISETTNQTNVALAEIKQLETEVNDSINIPDNLVRANKISDRLEDLKKSINNKVKSKTIVELLTNRINFILGNLHKKIIEIKDSDKGILELLPNLIANIISFIINLTIYIIPILIIGFLIIYVLYSESEYADAIRIWIKNLFTFSEPKVVSNVVSKGVDDGGY